MKTKLNIFSLTLTLFLLPIFSSAQDIHFSQFFMSPLTVNPSLAGAQHDLQTVFNYKNQWQSVASPYKTMAFSFDTRIGRKKDTKGFLAAGINFFSDKAGDAKLGTTQAAVSVAYHVHLNTYNTLGGGLSAGYGQRSMNYAALTWGNQYDGLAYNSTYATGEPGSSGSFSYVDFGGGLDWNYDNTSGAQSVTDNHDKKFNIGVGIFHVNQPKYSFYGTGEKLYMKEVVHGTATLSVAGSNMAFVPGFMYSRQGSSQEFFAGTMIRYTLSQDSKYTGFKQGAAISMGAYLRAKDAVAAMVLLEYSNYALGVSYDINISPLKTASMSRGGFEISLRFVTPNPFQPKTSSSFFN
jgi:type IX secretion system PorP/SprF family membrane protein